MRQFIVSDLHGCGEVYDSIMGYLDNLSLTYDVILYINGDLIDRGLDGYRMLNDVIDRINGKGNVRIVYLAGNHELMMYQALLKRKDGEVIDYWSDWMSNGGWIIEGELDLLEDYEVKCNDLKQFLGNLKIYHKFNETINNNNILLVHAQTPSSVNDICKMTISDNDKKVEDALWKRREIRDSFLFFKGDIIGYNRIGLDGYFTIIGHTPVDNVIGFEFNREENYLNIDGGCARFACGDFNRDKVPLIEVKDNKLYIYIFNHNNEIVNSYIFDGNNFKSDRDILEYNRCFINHNYDNSAFKVKKLISDIYFE